MWTHLVALLPRAAGSAEAELGSAAAARSATTSIELILKFFSERFLIITGNYQPGTFSTQIRGCYQFLPALMVIATISETATRAPLAIKSGLLLFCMK